MIALTKLSPNDFGPIYTETDLSRFPVEPWNTFSNLIFLIIVVIYLKKTAFSFTLHPMLVSSLPVLLLGWVGGTFYHATRSHNIWLLLDFVPIIIIALSGAIYLWRLFLPSWLLALAATLGPFLSFRLLKSYLPLTPGSGISIGYTVLAMTVIAPAIIQIRRTQGRHSQLVVAATMAFIFAVLCRTFDKLALLPMGTHFLWHIFGGVSSWLMLEFVYRTDLDRAACCS